MSQIGAQRRVIELRRVSRRYGPARALDDVSLEVFAGSVVALSGGRGAGKTTLLKVVAGLLRVHAGEVRVFGHDPTARPSAVLSRLGYVGQDSELPRWMSVGELFRFCRGFRPRWDQRYAEELRERFQLPLGARVSALSKGQLATAELALALAHRPELLVLDEPGAAAEAEVPPEMLGSIVRNCARQGGTVLLASSRLDPLRALVDQVVGLSNGRLEMADGFALDRSDSPLPPVLGP